MFEEIPSFLESMGIYSVILPLLFISVLIYGILSSIKVLGDKKIINLIVSFIIGFYVIKYTFLGSLMAQMLQYMSIAVTGIFVFLLVLGTMLLGAGRFKTSTGDEITGLQYLVRKRALWFIGLALVVFLGIFINLGDTGILDELGISIDIDSLTPYIIFGLIAGSVIWLIKYLASDSEEQKINKLAKKAKDFDRDHLNGMNAYGGIHPYTNQPHYNPYAHELQKEINKKRIEDQGM